MATKKDYTVRIMHQDDGCAHLIEAACFPSDNRLGYSGILEFLRQPGNFGLTVIEYDPEVVRREAYFISERRTNGFTLPFNPEASAKDWRTALQYQKEKCAFVLASISPEALMIERICVLPNCQRRRFGTDLLLAIAKRLPMYGLNRMMAIVGLQHDGAQKFFSSRWFTKTRHKLSGVSVFERTFENSSHLEKAA